MTQIEVKALQEQLIKIGELAKQTNVTVGTLRYYESLGLLEPAFRNNKNYRYYTDDAVKQVQFIKKAQSLNFSLAEIQQILGIRRQGIPPCSLVRNLLECKIAEFDRQIQSTLAPNLIDKSNLLLPLKKSWKHTKSFGEINLKMIQI